MAWPPPLLALLAAALVPWGYGGHEMASRAAARILPADVPAFFADAEDQLAWLGPEPDRWRVRDRPAMDQAWAYDHYVDTENVPPGALEAADRFTFLRALTRAGIERPERDVGFLPYRILELYDRLAAGWRAWREAPADSDRRRWIEQRIVYDAGILGHYVADGSQPLHTTIHFNGWAADVPNPEGFSRDRNLHSRFERYFVDAHVTVPDLLARLPLEVGHAWPDETPAAVRGAVLAYLHRSFETVPDLYRIERDGGFLPDRPADAEAHDFTADRLAAGADMLARLWLSAWRESGSPPAPAPAF